MLKKESDIVATITSVASGQWGTAGTWDSGVPVNGDTVIITASHRVIFNADQSGFANGLANLEINGILSFRRNKNTYLKMNGNITGTGQLIVASEGGIITSGLSLVEGKSYTYKYTGVTFGVGDYGIVEDVINNYETLEEVNSVNEVELTPGSYFIDVANNTTYVHYPDGSDPTSKIRLTACIQRAATGTESRCQIVLTDGNINVPIIKILGWYHESEYTTLLSDVNAGQNQIVLTEDLGFQQG